MGIFGSDEEEEKEEVTIGLKENSTDSEEDESSGAVDVGAVDFDETDDQGHGSGDEGNLRRQVEQQVSGDGTSDDINLKDLHEQNEEIKRKLDTIISSL